MTSTQGRDEGEIRKELEAELAGNEIDYDRVVALSSELARLDRRRVRFTADAAVISRLGRELVSKQETAVSELIKNAYDADATYAHLIFGDTDAVGGTLEIVDDGSGMSRRELVDGFMRISSMEKIENPVSPKYGRSRAGRKGIGRFAAQRLGKQLEIITQTEESGTALRVQINWSQFEGGRDLQAVSSIVEEVPKSREHGTTLVISDLREPWRSSTIRRIYRHITGIILPFPLSERSEHDSRDPGFKTRVFSKTDGDVQLVADESTEILQHSLATISGEVDSDGRDSWKVTSTRYELEETFEVGRDGEGTPLSFLQDIRFEAEYFIYKGDLIPHGYLTTIRELAQEQGGIRVYRNGFRVLPYGEPGDDWLHLDEVAQRRVVLPPVANKNFFGFVAIEDPSGNRFEETSSREGLLENQALEELRKWLHGALIAGVQKVAEVRKRKQTAGQRDWEGTADDVGGRLKAAAADLVEVGDEGLETSAKSVERTRRQERFEEAVEEILEELGMLRVLASLGLSIGEFTHEIKNSIGSVAADTNFLAHELNDEATLGKRAIRLKANIDHFNAYSAYFDQAVARNVSRELEVQSIRTVIKTFVKSATPGAKKYGIRFLDPEIDGYDIWTCPMHPSEWPAILFNLYTNAKKAIDRIDAKQGKILIRAGRDDSRIFVEFQDNGVGIPPNHRERVFDAFFTTMPPAGYDAPEDRAFRGSGLGLKIVRDIVSSYGGEIFIGEAIEGMVTCIRIELPSARDEEIP